MLATESFFKADGTPAKEMEGGNEASAASGITHSPKANRNAGITIPYRVSQPLKGGNGVSEANVVTLCSKCEIPHCVSPKTPLDVACPRAALSGLLKSLSQNNPSASLVRGRVVRRRNFNHKELKEHKELKGGNGVREANVVTLPSAPRKPPFAASVASGSRT